MSPHVTHIVGEVESPVHAQELRDLLHQYPQTLLVKKKWLESCFANQRKFARLSFTDQPTDLCADWGYGMAAALLY
ncbi:hypothetical protein QQF64_028565 [Cirrhinus molitorella]|uniref:BRCT domain-containing protein n=1 Tax=Cirrhinus molitorella TaxID=172907 RepID=A0ABR3N6X9_9TELE